MSDRSLTVAGMFAGIGGIELGFERAGHSTEIMCEIDPLARHVLKHRFPDRPIHDDITTLRSVPNVDVIAAGFPCQDLSLAGTRAGLEGARSGLVGEVFRLAIRAQPEFIILENVFHLLRLSRGANLGIVLDALEELGYRWAYRVVDTRGFGLPQRRLRVIILASRGDIDPSSVLFRRAVEPDFDDSIGRMESGHQYGFYWTEGKRGVGWARDAVPTIKGGSGLGIPSPPAVFDYDDQVAGTISIRDAERLQGFRSGWTDVPHGDRRLRPGPRWKMVGNAVSVPVARWLGDELARSSTNSVDRDSVPLTSLKAWPSAASGGAGTRRAVRISTHVAKRSHVPIGSFLLDSLQPMSAKALLGYVSRAESGTKTFPPGFLNALKRQSRSVRVD